MPERLLEMVGRFERGYPDIALDAPMLEALRENDPSPMFVTVPIAEVGATSRNGHTYDREAVLRIVAAVNSKRVTGEQGHLRDEDRPYNWEPAPIRWVKAMLDEVSGTAWGKFYVLPSAAGLRDFLRVAMATNAAIGTSIYGTARLTEDGNIDPSSLEIESIDLAHPDRLGVPQLAQVPAVTKETAPAEAVREAAASSGPIHEEVEEESMPEENVVLSELRAANDRLTARVRELEALEESNRQLTRDFGAVRTQLAIAEAADPVRAIHALQTTIADQETRLRDLTDIAIAEAVNAAVEVVGARAFVSEQLGLHLRAEGHSLPNRDTIRQVLESVLKRDSVNAHIQAAAQAAMGPNVTASSRNPAANAANGRKSVDEFFPVAGAGEGSAK